MDLSVVSQKDFTWLLSNGNPYAAPVTTTRDGVSSRVEQTVDADGNQTQQKVFNTDMQLVNARVYNYTYQTGTPYARLHIRNRLKRATLTAAKVRRHSAGNSGSAAGCSLLPKELRLWPA